MQLHPDVAQLGDLLRRIESHLARYGAARWASMVGRSRLAVENSDAWGMHDFLAMFGGMGSLNDVVLQSHGKILTAENDEFYKILWEAKALATRLQREEVTQPHSK